MIAELVLLLGMYLGTQVGVRLAYKVLKYLLSTYLSKQPQDPLL